MYIHNEDPGVAHPSHRMRHFSCLLVAAIVVALATTTCSAHSPVTSKIGHGKLVKLAKERNDFEAVSSERSNALVAGNPFFKPTPPPAPQSALNKYLQMTILFTLWYGFNAGCKFHSRYLCILRMPL